MANGSNGAKEDRIWLALCTATGVAVDVTLNKYSAILPGIAVLLLWAIPAVLFVVWFWRVEKTRDWVKSRFLEHPVSYALMFLILIPFAWQATATVVSKLSLPAAKRQTAKTDPHIAGVVSHPPSAAPIAPPPAAAPIARRKPTHSAPDHSAQPAPTPVLSR
jgi:hypothetical protein